MGDGVNLLRWTIRAFDDWLGRLEGVEPFTYDPGVILRVQEGAVGWDVPLVERTIPRGSAVLFVHLWNDRIPRIPASGPDLRWAVAMQRHLIYSFGCLGRYLAGSSRLDALAAVGGTIAQVQLHGPDGGRLFLEHMGFEIFPYHRPAGAFGEFWENFYTWWLMWAYNPAGLTPPRFLRLRRNEFWMTAEAFRRRFPGQ